MEHRERVSIDVFNKYLEIKQDIMSDLKRVFLRPSQYTKKYRGNLMTDIHVGVSENDYNEHRVQIFVRHDGVWIRDIMIYNSKGLKSSEIKTNMNYA
jgi:hypothetical protein